MSIYNIPVPNIFQGDLTSQVSVILERGFGHWYSWEKCDNVSLLECSISPDTFWVSMRLFTMETVNNLAGKIGI